MPTGAGGISAYNCQLSCLSVVDQGRGKDQEYCTIPSRVELQRLAPRVGYSTTGHFRHIASWPTLDIHQATPQRLEPSRAIPLTVRIRHSHLDFPLTTLDPDAHVTPFLSSPPIASCRPVNTDCSESGNFLPAYSPRAVPYVPRARARSARHTGIYLE